VRRSILPAARYARALRHRHVPPAFIAQGFTSMRIARFGLGCELEPHALQKNG
jgi:hypothetical protein